MNLVQKRSSQPQVGNGGTSWGSVLSEKRSSQPQGMQGMEVHGCGESMQGMEVHFVGNYI